MTVDDLRVPSEDELVRLLGQSSGRSLHRLARAVDDRPVVAHRETKSVSVEDTFDHDIADRLQLETIIDRMARNVSARLRKNGLSGRTITLKLRRPRLRDAHPVVHVASPDRQLASWRPPLVPCSPAKTSATGCA
ncbi:hypothetical protein ACHMWU_21330 [Aeromicrobium sp. UC242_57]